MREEEWKDVVGYEGIYQVLNHGRVRAVPRVAVRCNGRSYTVKGNLLDPWEIQDGYQQVGLYKNLESPRVVSVHRLVLEAFVGPCPKGQECRHLDGMAWNNRLENLKWGTRKEQSADRERHGTHRKGPKSVRAKLVEDDVQAIRLLLRIHDRRGAMSAVARKYEVDTATIRDIRDGRTWEHLTSAVWEEPVTKMLECPVCRRLTLHSRRESEATAYHYKECTECQYYQFAFMTDYQSPLQFGDYCHPRTQPRGSGHKNSKLDEKKVRGIRRIYARKEMTQVELAGKYGIHQSVVSDVLRGATWKHVD